MVGTGTVSSDEQVKCLTEWGKDGKALTLGGNTLTVSKLIDNNGGTNTYIVF